MWTWVADKHLAVDEQHSAVIVVQEKRVVRIGRDFYVTCMIGNSCFYSADFLRQFHCARISRSYSDCISGCRCQSTVLMYSVKTLFIAVLVTSGVHSVLMAHI